VSWIPWLAGAYLLGAVPTSFVAGKLGRGIDLRAHGSKNLGATNVFRILGWKYAIPVVLVDIAKGAVPVALFGAWSGLGAAWAAAFGATAVLGHVFSPFVGFRGGKGVATAAGMFIALAPLAVAIALPSVSSIVASITFPVWVRLTEPAAQPAFYASLGLAGLIVFSHRANIRRLLAGTENRFRTRKEIHA